MPDSKVVDFDPADSGDDHDGLECARFMSIVAIGWSALSMEAKWNARVSDGLYFIRRIVARVELLIDQIVDQLRERVA